MNQNQESDGALPHQEKPSINWAELSARAEIKGQSFRDLVSVELTRIRRERQEKAEAKKKKRPPKVFFDGMIQLSAGRAGRTPGQLFRSVMGREETKETPKDIQNWYAKIYGDFSKPPLADLLEEIYRRVLKDDSKLIASLDEAIIKGNIKWLEELTCCVALIHGIPYAGNGQARRVAGATARNVLVAYTRLFGINGRRPSAGEIRVEMARYACYVENSHGAPKFSDVWYLLRSGPKNDSDDEPGHSARYEVTGIKNIKKTLKLLKTEIGPPLHGPLTVKRVKFILDKWGMPYVDDSELVT